MPHRTREAIPRDCPVLVTLRVLDDVPALRLARFAVERPDHLVGPLPVRPTDRP